MGKDRKRIDLVLSMGGARGMAHIGVIKELLHRGYEIASITGSSMGAMAGAMYAAGVLDDCEQWFRGWTRKTMWHMVDISFNSRGVVKGDRFMKELACYLPDCLIEDLSLPFKAFATDVAHGCAVGFVNGSLHKAIRASISIPFLFCPPYDEYGRVLVDGGILNPLPLENALRTSGSLLVAVDVNVSDGPVGGSRMNIYRLLTGSSRLMMQQISRNQMEKQTPDLLIRMSASGFDMMDFHRSSSIISAGQEAARQACTLAGW